MNESDSFPPKADQPRTDIKAELAAFRSKPQQNKPIRISPPEHPAVPASPASARPSADRQGSTTSRSYAPARGGAERGVKTSQSSRLPVRRQGPHREHSGIIQSPITHAASLVRGRAAEKIEGDHVRIIPLGGLEEVGRNMAIIEYHNQIIIIDMGLQFPEEDMPGIDYIIPNISYITENKEKEVVGVFITHGHMDHIGAIPHIMPRIGNPPLYATALTRGMILRRQEDFQGTPKLNIQEINRDSTVNIGPFEVEFFHVNHNIPGAVGVVVHTPHGTIMHTGDFKFDHSPTGEAPADFARIVSLGAKGIDVLMSDSTNSESPGHTISESEVQKNLEEIVKQAPGRIIAATFGSLVSRVQQLITLAEKYNRKVALDGYSMKGTFEIARELGFIKVQQGTIIDVKNINDFPANRVMLISTGAQGEGEAVLMRIANREHRTVQIQKGDTIIFSSSVVPGNERSVQSLKDVLMYQGAHMFHSKLMDIHASGHASVEDLKLMINLVKPGYLIPIHGNHYMLRLHGDIAESMGMAPDHVVILGNGQVAALSDKKLQATKERVPTNYVMVDGLGIGDVGNVVLRDRQAMAKDGMLVVISLLDTKTGKVRGNPDIISRGFIYLRESKDLLDQVRKRTKEIVETTATKEYDANDTYVKEAIRDRLGQFLFQQTKRRPMVLPVIIKV